MVPPENIFMKRAKCLLLLTLFCVYAHSANYLFKDGKTDYAIVVQSGASVSERTAAQELREIIKSMSACSMTVTEVPANKNIFIGWTEATGVSKPAADDERYTYKTIGDNLYIFGGRNRGTMYGVYSFLERELGVHWYTSSYTKIPKRRQFLIGNLEHTESPAIRYRLDFFYDALHHQEWLAHNCLNSQNVFSDSKYGQMSSYWKMHTFNVLIPPATYFEDHPNYFSLYKGRRVDNGQLCLSNEDMRKELVKNLKRVIDRNPDYWCYDVSQNDNEMPCECKACQRLVKKYGGQSGAMIWFVNQVANEIKLVYPGKYIGTFAYRYTRQAPKSRIIPADNVVVRLCSIECCMAHPLEQCEQNRSFVKDMNDWQKITGNIYVWNYTTGFHNYLLPFPNFKAMASNYRFFGLSNVIGLLEEGAYDAPWSEFSELKQWLIAKLMWNPAQDVDSLAAMFINDYYGRASSYVNQYYDLCLRQISPETHFTIKLDWKSAIYNDKFIVESMALMEKALAVLDNNSEEYNRTRRIAAQVYYLNVCRNRVKSRSDGTRRKLKEIIAADSTIVVERGRTLENQLRILDYD